MQKKLIKIKQETEREGKIDDNTRDTLEDLETAVNAGHKVALKMLAKLFDWLDTLERKGTREIMLLYEQSTTIDRNISETLARMTQLVLKKARLEQLISESNGIRLVSRIHHPGLIILTLTPLDRRGDCKLHKRDHQESVGVPGPNLSQHHLRRTSMMLFQLPQVLYCPIHRRSQEPK